MDYIKGGFIMAVPEEIRKVSRPKNTVVDDNGKDGPRRYAVRERASIKYVPGSNPQPRNGKVLGHITEGKYIPILERTAINGPEMLSYGAAALVRAVTTDLFSELLAVYPVQDAYAIMSIATLRVIKPSVTSKRMSSHYSRTFVCQDYPGAALSPNSICSPGYLLA
jgi:hypothetical protein